MKNKFCWQNIKHYLFLILLFIPAYLGKGQDNNVNALTIVVVANYVPVVIYSYAIWLIHHFMQRQLQVNDLTIVRVGQDKALIYFLIDSMIRTLVFNTLVFLTAYVVFGLPIELLTIYILGYVGYNIILYLFHLYMLAISKLTTAKVLATVPIMVNLLLHYTLVELFSI